MGDEVSEGLGMQSIQAIWHRKAQEVNSYSPLTLAYLGDAVYEMIVRTVLVEAGNASVNILHRRASQIVRAEAQKDAYFRIKELLTEEEDAVFRRGRNAKSATSAKNASIVDYRIATGYEALFGYWYLTGQTQRMLSMAKLGMTVDGKDASHEKVGMTAEGADKEQEES